MDARSVLGVVATLENAGVPSGRTVAGVSTLWSASRPGSTMTSIASLRFATPQSPATPLPPSDSSSPSTSCPPDFVVRDRCDRRIDFHTVTFDAIGAATQRLQNGTMAPYRAHGFTGFGHITGVRVPCLTEAV